MNPCHRAHRLQTSFAALASASLRNVVVAAATGLALGACGGGGNADPEIQATPVANTMPQSAEALGAERADPAYFPSQFPAPDGEVEPLPEQF